MNTTVNTLPIILIALFLGAVYAVVSERTRFCTMGAVADWAMGSFGRMAAWLWAMAVAAVGLSMLSLWSGFSIVDTIYAQPRFLWLSHLVGGALFGVGMALSSGCAARSLVRAGGGNLKSVVVIGVTALTAYATMKGILSVPRRFVLEPFSVTFPHTQDLPSLLAEPLGVSVATLMWVLPLIMASIIAVVVWRNADFREPSQWMGGTIVGLLIVLAWWSTGVLGFLPEHPDTLEAAFIGTNSNRAESFSMLAPLAYGMELLILWSDASRVITFGIALALGMLVGALAHALMCRKFRWESFRDSRDMLRHLVGAMLMGFGGVCAVGCSLGQGISGVSTLALGSLLTTASMIGGCFLTIKWLMR